MNWLNDIIGVINNYLWSYVLIVMLIGIGLWFTIRTRFVQIRCIPEMFRLMTEGAGAKPREGHISTFQAFCVSTASRVGVGNIAGIAIAVATGGPGAVFWMWVIATIGAASGFVESTLAQIYKAPRKGGGFVGGPAYYIGNVIGSSFFASLFAVLLAVTYGLIFNSVQANTISLSMQTSFGFDTQMTGLAVAGFTALVIFGGLTRIAKVVGIMVPVMAGAYIIVALAVTALNITMVPEVLVTIVRCAFDFDAVLGAGFGMALMTGIKRGLFSNEAGMGSTPHAHAVARVKHPAEQGLAAIIGLFIDTFIVVNMTAFVILCTGALDGTTTGIALTQKAFTLGLGTIGNGFVAVCLLFFAFTTIVGWYFFAEQNVKYLVGVRYVSIYRVLVLAFIMAGSFLHVTLVWELADLFNGLMVIPNIIALIGLSKIVGRALEDYEKKFLAGETPEFGELAPVPADIPRYNGAPAQDPVLDPKPHRRLGGLRNRFRRRPHNAPENQA